MSTKSYSITVSMENAPENIAPAEIDSDAPTTEQKCDACDKLKECSARVAGRLHAVCESPFTGDYVIANQMFDGTDDDRIKILLHSGDEAFIKGYSDGIRLKDVEGREDEIYNLAYSLGQKVKQFGISNS